VKNYSYNRSANSGGGQRRARMLELCAVSQRLAA
jgi:hypothetical protein